MDPDPDSALDVDVYPDPDSALDIDMDPDPDSALDVDVIIWAQILRFTLI